MLVNQRTTAVGRDLTLPPTYANGSFWEVNRPLKLRMQGRLSASFDHPFYPLLTLLGRKTPIDNYRTTGHESRAVGA
jgi:hypothetical protein